MQNYFNIFDIPISFEVDLILLKERFNKKILEFHPDSSISFSDKDQLIATQNMALINTAYTTMSNDLSRGVHILEINNINAFDERDTKMSNDFLLEQIDLQEDLEELSDETSIEEYLDNISLKVKENILNLRKSFENNHLSNAKNLIRELKFYTKLQARATEKFDDFI